MQAGQTLSHFTNLRPIGQGGLSEVFLAEDTRSERHVALKVLPPDLTRDDLAKVLNDS